MKIYLLALLGLAAGGAVKTISNSSTSDSTVAAPPPDSSAPVAASSDTSHTTVSPTISTNAPPSSISIDSTNSSPNSSTAPAGDDIQDIAVSMTFAVEAIDDGSDEEMLPNIKKSVAATLDRVLGTDVAMNNIEVVETAPSGRRLGVEDELKVTYVVKVKESYVAAAEYAIKNDLFDNKFAASLTAIEGEVKSNVPIVLANICWEKDLPTLTLGTYNCKNKMVVNSEPCKLNCPVNHAPGPEPGLKCTAGATGAEHGTWTGSNGACVRVCAVESDGQPKLANGGSGPLPTVDKGKLNCKAAVGYNTKTLCNLSCTDSGDTKSDSGVHCDDKSAWVGFPGECTNPTRCVKGGDYCKKGVDVGKCSSASPSACVVDNECQGLKMGAKCGELTNMRSTLTGKCAADDGKCTHVDPMRACTTAEDYCRQSDFVAKCFDDGGGGGLTCTKKVCGALNAECGDVNDLTSVLLKGKCATLNGNCVHDDKQGIAGLMKFEVNAVKLSTLRANSGTDVEDFKIEVRTAVAASLMGVNLTDVTIHKFIVPDERRRLDGKFLEGAPTRMLQVEYSVQVNQSAAAATKAALDTFTYSSNST